MSEFQPGMLALVIRSSMLPESVGTTVTCDERVFINEHHEYDDKGTPAWKVSGSSIIPDGAGCYERNLLPLPPISDPLDVTHKVELHA